jgi:hypothetical protein
MGKMVSLAEVAVFELRGWSGWLYTFLSDSFSLLKLVSLGTTYVDLLPLGRSIKSIIANALACAAKYWVQLTDWTHHGRMISGTGIFGANDARCAQMIANETDVSQLPGAQYLSS